jgi:hypothetical protein
VFMSPIKETNFFSQLCPDFAGPGDDELNRPLLRNPDGSFRRRHSAIVTSRDEYLQLFSESEAYLARGEVSPSYLYYPVAAANIRWAIPDCKIIILLRDPVDRAFSNYKALVWWGRESLNFEAALQMEDDRIQRGWEHIWALKGLGLYSSQVKRYIDAFPCDQIGVWLYEELKRDPEKFYREICSFIGVSGNFLPKFSSYNKSVRHVGPALNLLARLRLKHAGALELGKKLIPPWARERMRSIGNRLAGGNMAMRPETESYLREYFHDDIIRLQELLPKLNIIKGW